MVDKNTFMETLHLVQEIAGASETPMDKKTALSYFKDMELSAEQQEMVYQFLMLPPEVAETTEENTEEAETFTEDEEKGKKAVAGEADSESENRTSHFQLYLDEIDQIAEMEAEAEEKLYHRLLDGDTSVIGAISNQWLKRVISIAEEYKDKGYLLDDLVQEGNIGLLMGLNELAGKGQNGEGHSQSDQTASIPEQLRIRVKEAIEQYLGEESGENQQNETILAKVSLVHEARRLLTEEKGEQPSLRELSDYTKVPVEEITDILSLVKDSKT